VRVTNNKHIFIFISVLGGNSLSLHPIRVCASVLQKQEQVVRQDKPISRTGALGVEGLHCEDLLCEKPPTWRHDHYGG
jgi:hypothetical protein